jgi:hypothetical protein
MGTYRSPQVIQDPLANVLSKSADEVNKAAVNYIVSAENQKRLQERKRNALNKDLYELDLASGTMPPTTSDKFDEDIKAELKRNFDNVHRLGMEAIRTGDYSEYYREKARFEGAVKKLPVQLQVMSKQAATMKEGDILNNQNSRDLDMFEDFSENNAANLNPVLSDGNWLFNYSGKDNNGQAYTHVVSPDTIVANVESGGGITLLQSPREDLEKLFKSAAGNNYSTLVEGRQYMQKGDESSYNKKRKDYSLANATTRANLTGEDSSGNIIADPLNAQYNQNNWQFFMGDKAGVFEGTDDQKKVLNEKMVNFMMDNFGLPDEVVTFTGTTVDETTDTSKTEIFTTSQKAEINTRQKDYIKDFNEVKNIESLGSESAKKEALVKAANSRAGTKGPVLKYENGEIYKLVTSGAKTVKIAEPLDINVGTGGYYEMQNLLNNYRPDPISSEVMGYFRKQQLGTKTSGKGPTNKPASETTKQETTYKFTDEDKENIANAKLGDIITLSSGDKIRKTK